MDNVIIGQRIKELRLKRRMTREDLAEAAELSVSFLYEIETGKKGFSAYTLGNLSKALNIESDYILLGELEEGSSKSQIGVLSRKSLLYVQRKLIEMYNEIQELIDGYPQS